MSASLRWGRTFAGSATAVPLPASRRLFLIRFRPRALLALGLVTALVATVAGGNVAFAFNAGAGFAASTFATGYGSSGPAGVAFIGSTMYTVDPGDGYLYSTISGVTTPLALIGDRPTGIAATGGFLYITRSGPSSDIVRVDPTTGTILATVASSTDLSGLTVHAIAADPSSGDLFVTSDYIPSDTGLVWRITGPASATPSASTFLSVSGSGNLYGIAVAQNHWIFVADAGTGFVWRIFGPGSTSSGSPSTITTSAGVRGVAITADGFLFTDSTDGSVQKTAVPGLSTGTALVALTGGAGGDLSTIGTDGCYYVSQGPAIVRLANVDGSCNLGTAAPPPPPPALTLVRTSSQTPLLGDGDQSFSATLANVTNPAGTTILFTVTRDATSTTTSATAGANGVASFSYRATSVGTDVITASAVVNAATVTSNSITLTWLRALDTTPPTITYVVDGAHGTNYACPDLTLGTPGSVDYCGWFVSAPTIHWTVTATGTSGLGTVNCPDFTLTVSSPLTGTPTTCQATNGDGAAAALKVVLEAALTIPTITASATTADGLAYAPGALTNQSVTVRFDCATDTHLGPGALVSCGPTQTVSASTTTVIGTAVDVAGNRATATFGPIVIDTTPPAVTASMTTATDGHAYVPGTPTTQDVIVTFSCTDNVAMSPTGCPAPVRATSGPSVTVSATDQAGNTASFTFGGINIDRTPPTVSATVSPHPDGNGNNSLTATVTITGADTNGVASITYSATGAEPIPTTTVVGGSAAVTITAIGPTTLSYVATDTAGNVSAVGTTTVKVIATQASSLTITSGGALLLGGVTVSARLVGADGTSPVAGRTVTFTAGNTPATAITGANGVATTTLALGVGSYTLRAAFAGDSAYFASPPVSHALVVYAPSQFVVWGGNPGGVAVGQHVVFWGDRWWDGVTLPDKAKVKDFKGWASAVRGATWTAKPGDSGKPPKTIATYISVLVTTSVQRLHGDGDLVTGNVTSVVIVRVDDPAAFKGDPGHGASGVIVATLP